MLSQEQLIFTGRGNS